MNLFKKTADPLLPAERPLDFYPLEERVLLDGDAIDGMEDGDVAIDDALLAEWVADGEAGYGLAADTSASQKTSEDSPELTAEQTESEETGETDGEAAFSPAATRTEVIFVDAAVDDADSLLSGLRADGDAATDWLVVYLDSESDGVEQITKTLQSLEGIDAVHILSHGDGTGIQLGSSKLDAGSAAGYAGDLASWANALDANADVLIYGCDLASTAEGQALVEMLAAVTDADVAASDDLTGHEELGGNWDLEYSVGTIDTVIAFGAAAQQDWTFVLNTDPSLTASSSTATYTENDAPVYDSGATLTDPDSANFDGGIFTVSIVDNGTANDRLAIRDIGTGVGEVSISGLDVLYEGTTIGTFSGGTDGSTPLNINLNANATVAAVQALARATTYSNVSENPFTATRTIRSTVSDGDGGTSGPSDVAMTVVAVNDTPTISSDGGGSTASMNLGENATSVTTVTTTDPENDPIGYSITGGADAGLFSIDASTGVLTLATAPDFEAPADSDTDNVYEVVVMADDGNGGTGSQTISVTVDDVNEAPVIADLAADSLTYNTGDGAVVVEQGADAAVSDVDSADFDGGILTVSLFVGTDPAEDVLSIRHQGMMAGQIGFDGSNLFYGGVQIGTAAGGGGTDLVVNLNANATPTAVADLVKNITYENTDTVSPTTGARGVRFVLSDGDGATSKRYDATVEVVSTTTASVLDRFSSSSYSQNDGTAVWSTDWVETDSEGGDAASGRIKIASGKFDFQVAAAGNNVHREADLSMATSATLSFDYSNALAGVARLDVQVSSNGGAYTTVAVFDGSTNWGSGSKSIDIMSDAAVDTSVRFYAVSGETGAGNNQFRADNVGIAYTINRDPVLSLPGFAVDYRENDTPVVIDATATVTDAELTDFDTGTLTVDFAAGGTANDRLAIRNEGTAAGEVGVSGSNVTYGGATVGAFSGGTNGSTPLVITFNAGADTSAVEAVTRNITYENVSDDPSTAMRSVRFLLTDGDGGTSNEMTESVNVTAVNDAPVLTASSSNISYTENAEPIYDAGATFGDPDSANLDGGTYTLSILSNGTANDRLGIRNVGTGAGQISISGSNVLYEGTTIGTFSGGTDGATPLNVDLNANATVTAVQALARAATYSNVSEDPSAADRVLRTTISDGDGGTSTPSDVTVSVVPVNDAPTTSDQTVTMAEDTPHTFTASDFDFDDIEGDSLTSVQITRLQSVGSLQLGGVDVTRDQVITRADIDAGNLVFTAAADANGAAYDSFDFRVHDGTDYSDAVSTTALLAAGFDADEGGFAYVDLLNGGFASGTYDAAGGGGLKIELGGGVTGGTTSGAWSRSFTLTETTELTISTDYRLYMNSDYEADEYGELYLRVNGVDYGTDTNSSLVHQAGDGDGGSDYDSGWQTYQTTVVLGAGTHSLDLVAENNQGTTTNEVVTGYFDNVSITTGNYNTLSIDVTAINDAPVVTSPGSALSATEQVALAIEGTGFTVNDVDDAGAGVTAVISVGEGTLAIAAGDSGVAIDSGNNSGTVTLSGTVAQLNNLLTGAGTGSISYTNGNDAPSASTTLTLTVNDLGNTGSDPGLTGDGTSEEGSASQTINIAAVNDAPSITSDGGGATAAVNVAENSVAVTTVAASDPDGDTPVYSITGGADAAQFTINSSTGVLTFVTAPDAEAPSDADADNVYEVVVGTSDGAGGTDAQALSVSVDDVDEFDVGSVTDADATANTIAEDATVGTSVGITASASDADATTNTVTYILDDDAGGLFAVDANTGVVSVDGTLDYETATSHSITVRGNSADGSFSTAAFTINITDVNESGVTAISDTDAAADEVLENSANGTVVGVTAFADDTDGTDTVSFSLDDDAGGRFAIDAGSGVVTVAGAIDREAAATYSITVRATSTDSSTTTTTFNIAVTPENDNDPLITSDGGGVNASLSVFENDIYATSVTATDADLPAETLAYSIAGGDDASQFSIDSNSGVLSFVTRPNFESPADVGADNVYDVIVQVSDGTRTDTQAIAVTVLDVADDGQFLDLFNADAYNNSDGTEAWANSWVESEGDGSSNGNIKIASDKLRIMADTVNDSIYRETDLSDAVTATVSFSYQNSLNAAQSVVLQVSGDGGGSYTTLTTFDTGTNPGSDKLAFDISSYAAANTRVRFLVATVGGSVENVGIDNFQIEYVPNAPPAITSDGGGALATVSLAENTTAVTTVTALDGDTPAQTLVYSIIGGLDSAMFTIDASSGALAFLGAPDFESPTDSNGDNVYDVIVEVSDDIESDTQTIGVTVTDVNEFSVTSPADLDLATDAVDENAADGTTVGMTASASDADGTTNLVMYSLVDDAGGRFAVDANSGIVTVADGSLLDRESAASHNITVRATSADGSTADSVFTINVNDLDEFDVTAPADSDAAANEVDENAANGTAVGLAASASDADATTDAVTYSLTNDAGGRFAVDANSGIVTVADGSLLDRESAASHNVTVRATSADGSTADSVFTVNINDLDEFDVTAPNDSDAAANEVDENAANGTAVGLAASASDADATTDAVTYSLTDDAGGRFAVDANSGIVTVADGSLLDRESAASHNITVRATSADGSTADSVFTININDLDESDVTAPADSDAAANEVDENAANGTAVGLAASASDADATTDAVTYSLIDDAGGRFAVDANSGIVTVADGSLLDRESAASHNVTVRATSADGSIADSVFTINVNDLDEFDVTAPADTDAAANEVDENAANGTAVGLAASASDADATTDAVTYSLIDDAGGRFAVDANSGIVTVADGSLLDRESAASHNVTVRATSADGSTADSVFTINVNDLDEFDVTAPNDTDATPNGVDENAANGTAVGLAASASDADATTDAVTYSLIDDAGGRFAVDANSGIVTVADGSLLDRESAASHNVTVRATSADGSTADSVFTINVNDLDEFDVTAPNDTDAAVNEVDENTGNGTTVGITASAFDADATTSAVTYTLDDDAGGRFAIDNGTGIVTVADGSMLDFEAVISHNMTVRATSADGSFTTTALTIAVNDTNDNAPLIVNNQLGVVEGERVTLTLADLNATDVESSEFGVSVSGVSGGQFEHASAAGVAIENFTLSDVAAGEIEFVHDGSENAPGYSVTVHDPDWSTGPEAASITFTPVNDAPIIVVPSTSVVYTENAVPQLIAPAAVLSDSDNAFLASLTVELLGFQADQDRLVLLSQTALTTQWNPATARFTFSGAATVAEYESALHNLAYQNSSEDPNSSARTLQFTVSDGQLDSAVAGRPLQVIPINDAPIAVNDSFSIRAGELLHDPAPGVLSNDSDVDSDGLMTFLVSPPSFGTAVLSSNGELSYLPQPGFFGTDIIRYQISDGAAMSETAEIRVEVTAVGGGQAPSGGSQSPALPSSPDPGSQDDGGSSDSQQSESSQSEPESEEEQTSKQENSAAAAAAGVLPTPGQGLSPGWMQVVDVTQDGDGSQERNHATKMLGGSLKGGEAYREGAGGSDSGAGTGSRLEYELMQEMLRAEVRNSIVWTQWDQRREESMEGYDSNNYTIGAVGASAGMASVGYAMWAIRGGAFAATMFSSVPTWRLIDPAILLKAYRNQSPEDSKALQDLLR